MNRSKSRPVSELLQKISKRAEDLTREEQAQSYVSTQGLAPSLENRDNRIIFGRRGTGKTHLLSFLSKSLREKRGVPIFVDLRTIGSNSSIYSNVGISVSDRATRLIRDFLDAVQYKLIDAYTEPRGPLSGQGAHDAIDALSKAVRTVVVEGVAQETSWSEQGQSGAFEAATNAKVGTLGGSAEIGGRASAQADHRVALERQLSGNATLSVNIGGAFEAFERIGRASKERIWILVDEWSSVPEELQPYLADFLRRAVFAVQNITVHIAAIEYRSRFRMDLPGRRVGFELGSDIFADINLDDFFVYENNPEVSANFFRELLYKHLVALSDKGELEERSPKQVTDRAFTQERAFTDLVRASEGVPRDFINILQIAAIRAGADRISKPVVQNAAKDWYERDKERNIDTNFRAQQLLEFIRDRVIFKKKARAFLLRNTIRDETIEFLFDERLLHVAKRAYSSRDEPGVRYRVWKIDYGCYVDLLNTARAPTGYLFEDLEPGDGGEIPVPEDDFRAVRRAILDIEEFYKAAA